MINCFVCGLKRPNRMKGVILWKKICDVCFPHTDEVDIGGLIRFSWNAVAHRTKKIGRDKNK